MMYLSRLTSGTWKTGNDTDDFDPEAARRKAILERDPEEEKSLREASEKEASDALVTAGSMSSLSKQETLAKILKRRRIGLSLATLCGRPEKRQNIVDEGAIAAIIELAAIPDTITQKSCASAFSLLAAEPAIRKRMHEEGAVNAIITLSTVNNYHIKMECCKALCNLMCEISDSSTYESRAVRDGLPFTLVRIVPECQDAMTTCLTCLLNLTCVPDKYTRIEEVTDALLQLNNKTDLSDIHCSLILKGLTNLSALKSFQLRLLEDGCMKILEYTMKTGSGKGEDDRILASTVLRNLTTCYRTRPKLLDHNIVSMLVSMSRDSSESVQHLAVKAMYNLSRDGICRERIVQGNAVTVILKISRETGGNIAIGRLAAKTLRVLCGDATVAQQLVRDGIVKALMSLLRNDDASIQQYCAESICSLFQIDVVLGRLVEQGAVGVIVSLAQSSTQLITAEWCSFALYYLSTNRLCPVDTLEMAILPCLVNLCEHDSERTKYFCSAAFAYITLLKNIDSSGAIPVLVRMLEFEDDVDTKNNCITSLYNSADLDENCYSMLEAGALEPICFLTNSDSVQTRIECAAILCRLSLQSSFYDQFEEVGILDILLKLSSLEHTLTQRRVIIALSNLSSNSRLRAQLLKLNPIPYIIPLASKRDENLRRGCVSIVCNMSEEIGTYGTVDQER